MAPTFLPQFPRPSKGTLTYQRLPVSPEPFLPLDLRVEETKVASTRSIGSDPGRHEGSLAARVGFHPNLFFER